MLVTEIVRNPISSEPVQVRLNQRVARWATSGNRSLEFLDIVAVRLRQIAWPAAFGRKATFATPEL